MKTSHKLLKFEAELAGKTHDQLLETHKNNMDELDQINKRLLATLSGKLDEGE